MSGIDFECDGCQKPMQAPVKAAGQRAVCKTCGATSHVPRPLVLEPGAFRQHHYEFAHRFLPHMCFRGGMGAETLRSMATDKAGELLRHGWGSAASVVEPADRLPPDGLKARLIEPREGLTLAVVQLPQARRMVEALYVAGVYQPGGFRFVTLELSVDIVSQRPRTVLGEWMPGRQGPEAPLTHVNWGNGPPDSREAFVRAAVRVIDSSPGDGEVITVP